MADTETSSTVKSPLLKRYKAPFIATAIMLCLGLVGGSYWWNYGQYFESTDNAYLQGDITSISPKVSGYIVKSYISDNQTVKQGELLVQIDDRDYQTALEQASAHLKVAQASEKNLVAQQTLQRSQIDQAKSQVDSAQAEYDRAIQQVARSRSLLKRNYASQDEVDSRLAQQKVTLAQLDEAKANLVAAYDQLKVIASEMEQAQASVTEARAQQKQAQLNLDYTKIYAPADGVIGKRSVRDGLLVQAGTPLMSLVPDNGVWIEANFKETQISGIHTGQPVTITLDALPGESLGGIVDSFSPATGAKFALLPPENATGNFTKIVQRVPVKIVIPNQDQFAGRLLPGLSVVATIDTRG
ncbi:HlyD family secretion protein [Vibrio ostreicida]|uniref:HlyD family secretion protein n=1 Tax=Vibrio ostreicida TaxID=526588 RepID=A0ABT8BWJ4_9VIBR|nr:HlyD family secretion protein [Vibrio ostreicida]MDN3610477.1 HlyD family secretion protein [Vibrio ostreicida]NPD07520.1 HlyD family secretion protein [Vibrio ostreicida]